MRILFAIASLTLAFTMVGCGSDEPTNIMEGVDQSEYASYEEMVAADEAAMSQEDESGGTAEVAPAE